MPATFQSPGVYVQEIDRGVKPIQGVGTSLPAFAGITQRAGKQTSLTVDADSMTLGEQAYVGKPTLVANWTQYVELFGDIVDGAYLPDAVYGYFANGGGACYVLSLRTINAALAAGTPARKASVAIPGSGRTNNVSFRIVARSEGAAENNLQVTVTPAEDGTFTLQIGSEVKSGLTLSGEVNNVATVTFTLVEIVDVSPHPPKAGSYTLAGGADAEPAPAPRPLDQRDYEGDVQQQTGFAALKTIDELRLLVCPDLMAGFDGSQDAKDRVKAIQTKMIGFCEETKRCFAILDTPPGLSAQAAIEWRNWLGFDTSYAALYYPWVEVANLGSGALLKKRVPPSGIMAGVYNRTDFDRGVHKAPANETLRGVIGVERQLSRQEQDQLNPIGVNCIRAFPTQGIRAWGARTLSRSNTAWIYISVRRLFIYVSASLEEGLQWAVFEPNDSTLWGKVRRDVTAFLTLVWRSGALFGTTPEQAFYVKCDGELNPPDVRNMGQLIIEVGLAPVKPAEFVIVRISQWAGADAETNA